MKQNKNDSQKTYSASGTIASLGVLILFIILMWIGVFAIYMDRV